MGTQSLLDTSPLWDLLRETLHAAPDGSIPELTRSLEAGRLRAIALTASSYTTGQSVTWVQTHDGGGVPTWNRPQRVGVPGTLGIDHVMASAALPFFFLLVLAVAIITVFPDIVMVLPRMAFPN